MQSRTYRDMPTLGFLEHRGSLFHEQRLVITESSKGSLHASISYFRSFVEESVSSCRPHALRCAAELIKLKLFLRSACRAFHTFPETSSPGGTASLSFFWGPSALAVTPGTQSNDTLDDILVCSLLTPSVLIRLLRVLNVHWLRTSLFESPTFFDIH